MTVFEELMRMIRELDSFPKGVGPRIEEFFRKERERSLDVQAGTSDLSAFRPTPAYHNTLGELHFDDTTAQYANIDTLFGWSMTRDSKLCMGTHYVMSYGHSFNPDEFPDYVRDWVEEGIEVENDSLNYIEHDNSI